MRERNNKRVGGARLKNKWALQPRRTLDDVLLKLCKRRRVASESRNTASHIAANCTVEATLAIRGTKKQRWARASHPTPRIVSDYAHFPFGAALEQRTSIFCCCNALLIGSQMPDVT